MRPDRVEQHQYRLGDGAAAPSGGGPTSERTGDFLCSRLKLRSVDGMHGMEARRLPHVLVGGRSFHDREEILALRNALTAIEWPDDELRVYAIVRGPLFAFSDDALFIYRQTVSAEGELQIHRLQRTHVRPGDVSGISEALEKNANVAR
jgi:hypothetical protein